MPPSHGVRGVTLGQSVGWDYLVGSALQDKGLQLGLVGKQHLQHFPHGGLRLCSAHRRQVSVAMRRAA